MGKLWMRDRDGPANSEELMIRSLSLRISLKALKEAAQQTVEE
jgi:hypothetical protein